VGVYKGVLLGVGVGADDGPGVGVVVGLDEGALVGNTVGFTDGWLDVVGLLLGLGVEGFELGLDGWKVGLGVVGLLDGVELGVLLGWDDEGTAEGGLEGDAEGWLDGLGVGSVDGVADGSEGEALGTAVVGIVVGEQETTM